MVITVKRTHIDLPVDVLERLTTFARKSGKTLKGNIESVLTSKSEETGISPSGDTWFDDQENIRVVKHGITQLENGEGTVYTASELKKRLGV